ncbi:hypothetical protein NPIL_310331 [Nephila pilipes]|uniref:Uncharacterized protein n=1 Tax=Nephila pilipes TaxID=299642 RepID=A0A8X6P5G9_NEPPI|nr:hypothetical protein NPIL_310331 [Nephila pilipes]
MEIELSRKLSDDIVRREKVVIAFSALRIKWLVQQSKAHVGLFVPGQKQAPKRTIHSNQSIYRQTLCNGKAVTRSDG